jgi:hypothetical protein
MSSDGLYMKVVGQELHMLLMASHQFGSGQSTQVRFDDKKGFDSGHVHCLSFMMNPSGHPIQLCCY